MQAKLACYPHPIQSTTGGLLFNRSSHQTKTNGIRTSFSPIEGFALELFSLIIKCL